MTTGRLTAQPLPDAPTRHRRTPTPDVCGALGRAGGTALSVGHGSTLGPNDASMERLSTVSELDGSGRVLAATLDEHEDDTWREHEFVNGLSPLSSSVVARGQAA